MARILPKRNRRGNIVTSYRSRSNAVIEDLAATAYCLPLELRVGFRNQGQMRRLESAFRAANFC